MMQNKEHLISRSVAGITVSAIKDMAMRSAGIKGVASLTWGLPSFQTPAFIRQAVAEVLDTDPDIGKYTLPDGLPELRRLVAEKHLQETGIEVDPDKQVMIHAGNMQGLSTLIRVITDPGDEIIVTDPGFASHFHQVHLYRGTPVCWPMDESLGWKLDVDALAGLITARTKAIILVTPSNPTGTIFTETELRAIGRIALDHDLLILLDDPYSKFTYGNKDRFFNLASVPELADNIAYCFTFSKAYAMSGWRLSYTILPEFLKCEVLKVHDARIICAPRISQVAGIAALAGGTAHLKEFEDILARRRDLICRRLDSVPHLFEYVEPEGAYYVFPRLLVKHESSYDFAIELLAKAKVAVTPGSAFGPSGEHHVRMAYCVEEDVINTAFDRIEALYPCGR
ncbi:MAG: pyridoxal phosphate-dependent aminotransferase [Rhodospirillales bacterium]|nr:pyridoxal phosphate-dependent aminotransferase [Rhodospirillales bacterium]